MNTEAKPPAKTPVIRDTTRADAVFAGTVQLLSDMDLACVTELTLSNNRRADIIAVTRTGEIVIVEVKSCLADFASDTKWPDYMDFCDRFYFAVDLEFPQDKIPLEAGLIVADGFGGAILREATVEKLAGARRKAVTLTFARAAARRLLRQPDDAPAPG